MTARELNRDIKRLISPKMNFCTTEELKKEFIRLYSADRNFKYMNSTSIKIMLRLNLRYRFLALHYFGMHIELEDL